MAGYFALFGYERGAFTGAHSRQPGKLAAADTGTIFLDEIGDVSLGVQARLLRAIESRSIYLLGSTRTRELDIRILAATNQDLEVATSEKRYRETQAQNLLGIAVKAVNNRTSRTALKGTGRHQASPERVPM